MKSPRKTGRARRGGSPAARRRPAAEAVVSRRSPWKWRTPMSAMAPLLTFGHA